MSVPVYIPTADQFVSRYSLLGAFADELAAAFARAGANVNPAVYPGTPRAVFIIFNTPTDLNQTRAWIESKVGDISNAALLHYHVDHPLTLPAPLLDQLVHWPGHRLLLPCRDDTHILRFRWPTLKHITCEHGVAPSAFCNLSTLQSEHLAEHTTGARPHPVVAIGSIFSEQELSNLFEYLPPSLRPVAEAAAAVLASHPGMTFTQAFDYVLPAGMLSPDHWKLLATVQQFAVASANRTRRTRILEAMQGLYTVVYGSPAWEPFCVGSIRYGGEVNYTDIPHRLHQARVCLAWGPSQFAHTFSERLLLSMAAGCATVTDDRLLTRVAFGQAQTCLIEDFSDPPAVRDAVQSLLDEPQVASDLARQGRDTVAAAHLWDHRLSIFFAAAVDCFEPAKHERP